MTFIEDKYTNILIEFTIIFYLIKIDSKDNNYFSIFKNNVFQITNCNLYTRIINGRC